MCTQQQPTAQVQRGAGGSCRGAFTLIELLVVVAIIALLISILVPSLQSARDQAKTVVCSQALHQIGLSVQYYIDEYKDHLPYMRGAPGSSNGCTSTVAPYRQFDQIYAFWRYQKDLNIYKCPAAVGRKSAVERSLETPPGQQGATGAYYSALLEDDRWVNEARAWFPNFDVTRDTREDAAGDRVILPVSTEYWYNDFNSPDAETGESCLRVQNPFSGQYEFLGNVNGGRVSRLAVANQTITFTDAWHEIPRERHQGAKNVLFLDAHAEKMARLRTIDCVGIQAGAARKDTDSFGNAPYWLWGLTKFGRAESPDCVGLLRIWEDY